MVPKAGKPSHEVTSYRPISLLPIPSKVFEKLFMKRLQTDVELSHLFQVTNLNYDLAIPLYSRRIE